jgi:truncated hemoglobin YjbI
MIVEYIRYRIAEDRLSTFVAERTPVRGTGASVPSLYEWAGGTAALERLTRVFNRHVLADELIGPLFADMDDEHARHVAMWLAEVFGGPDRYTRDRGGYPAMLGHHLGRAITEPQRRRWVTLLLHSLDVAGLPTDPEFRAAFVGYIEWGTRLALTNYQPGAEVVRTAPVPHWGWGVAHPGRGEGQTPA